MQRPSPGEPLVTECGAVWSRSGPTHSLESSQADPTEPTEPQPPCRSVSEEKSLVLNEDLGRGLCYAAVLQPLLTDTHRKTKSLPLAVPHFLQETVPNYPLPTLEGGLYGDGHCVLLIPVSLDFCTVPGTEFKNSNSLSPEHAIQAGPLPNS